VVPAIRILSKRESPSLVAKEERINQKKKPRVYLLLNVASIEKATDHLNNSKSITWTDQKFIKNTHLTPKANHRYHGISF